MSGAASDAWHIKLNTQQLERCPSWSKEHDWKSCVLVRVPRVRIPPSPKIKGLGKSQEKSRDIPNPLLLMGIVPFSASEEVVKGPKIPGLVLCFFEAPEITCFLESKKKKQRKFIMVSKFLTNTDGRNSLSERVKGLTKASERLDFLIGYFFFSGFYEIYESLEDKPLRILVGMDAEVDLNNCIVEYATSSKENNIYTDSKIAVREKYFDRLKKIISKADILDSDKFEKTYHLFLKKLENRTLEVRKTKDPNHAKMYLFYIQDSSLGDTSKVIIGSSNFSIQGFRARNEVNVFLQDENDFKEGKQIFDALWEEAVPLIDVAHKEEFKKSVLKHTWLGVRPDPYSMYIRVLNEYFNISDYHIKTPQELTRGRINSFVDMSYQVDAIRDGIEKLKKHSGVIVADVVGLGKSIVASSIAANMNKRTVIISPPHLKSQWEGYSDDFGLKSGKVYTSGKIEEAVEENKASSDLVIIIDEAHRYRNETTESYSLLHRLCAGNQVILLSATPFNNRPEDIFSLIKLFQIPTKSTIQTVNDLGDQMAKLVMEYKNLQKEHRDNEFSEKEFHEKSSKLAQKIREILDPVIIRRTRVDLEKIERYRSDLSKQEIQFSETKPPSSQHYDLGDLTALYQRTIELLTDQDKGFKGARYKPLTYLKKDGIEIDKKLKNKYSKYFDDLKNFDPGQRNMADFMKRLLVRRFESSKFSFIESLKNIQHSMKTIRRWHMEFKKIPMIKQTKLPSIDELESAADDEQKELFDEKELFSKANEAFTSSKTDKKQKELWFVDVADMSEEFLKDLDTDIGLISGILKEWEMTTSDPKLDAIKKQLISSLDRERHRKIIIFTEFADTADYLTKEFEKAGLRSMKYSSRCATKSAQKDVRENFDAGYPKDLQKDDFDILVATDAISEGFSLHRAGTIYNYDIPYNPTRVIQRVGRINRINKKVFDDLYIYNFFPTDHGERESHTKEIATFKMKLIQAILGADTKILTDDETIDGYLDNEYAAALNEAASVSWDVEFRNELDRIKTEEKEAFNDALELPQRCRIARRNINYITEQNKNAEFFENIRGQGVLLFSKKGDACRFCFSARDGSTQMISPQAALTLFRAAKNEKGEKVSDEFYSMYETAKRESGVVKTMRQNSRSTQGALNLLKVLEKNTQNEYDKRYIKILKEVIEWYAIPTYYINQIAKLKFNDKSILLKIKESVPENYLDTIMKKEHRVGHEPEVVLLAEELI